VARLAARLTRLAVVLIGLLLIGIAALHLPSVRARVLDRVRSYAARELGISLQASSLGYNLLTRSVELKDVTLVSTSGSQPFLQADQATILFDLSIYLGRPIVSRISVTKPRLTLVRNPDGTVNLPAAREGPAQSSPLQLGVVSVTGLSLALDDRAAHRTFTLGPFDLSIDTGDTAGPPGAFGPGAFAVRAGDSDLSGTIAGRVAFDGARVRIEDLTVQSRPGRLVVSGWADVIGEHPAVSANVSATLDVAETARLARVDARGLAGRVEGTAEISGGLAAPVVKLAVASRGAEYPPLGSIDIKGRGSFSGTRAVIDGVDLTSRAGALHADGSLELGQPPKGAAPPPSHLDLRWSNLRIDDAARASGYPLTIETGSLATGSVALDFNARDNYPAALSRVRTTATTSLQPMAGPRSPDNLALSGRADLQLEEGRWSLRHAIRTMRAQTSVQGTMSGRLLDNTERLASTLSGRSELRVDDLAGVPPVMKSAGISVPPDVVEGLAGSMHATVSLAGTLERPRAQIDLATRDLSGRMLPHSADLDARLDVDADGVRMLDGRAVAGSTSVQASGRYSWRGPLDARFEVNQRDLSEIASQFQLALPVSGSARVEGTVSGSVTSRARSGRAALTLSAADVVIDRIAVGAVSAIGTVPLENGGLITVDATAPGIGGRAKLEIVNRPGYPVSGDVAVEHNQIASLVPPRYREQVGDLSGKVSATAHGSGQLADPAGIRGRVDLRVLDVTARGTHLSLTAPASITLADDRIAVDSMDLRLGQRTRATLRGQLGVAALPDPLQVHLDGPLSELLEIGSMTAVTPPAVIKGEGTVAFDLTVGGTLSHPLPGGTLAVRSASLTYGAFAPLTGLTVDALVDPTLITLRTVTAEWQAMFVTASGTVPWRVVLNSAQQVPAQGTAAPSRLAAWLKALPAEPARARMTIRASNLTQALLKDIIPGPRLRDIEAIAAATVVAEADRLSLEGVQATAVLDPASVTLAGVPFTQSVPTRLRLENGQARVDAFQWTAQGNSIVATGGADLRAAQPSIDLGLAGALDLRVLSAFVEGIASGGAARANLRITGPLDKPDIVGEIGVADAELQLDNPRLAVTDFGGTLLLGDNRKVTVSLVGLLNTGTARLSGTLDLADLAAPTGKLQFTGRNVALEYPPGLQTESDVDLDLALGTTSALNGRINVLDGTYREPLVLSSQLLNLSSASGIASAAPPPEWLSRLRLNVAVATASDVRIDNNYGRLDIGGSLRVVGTAASPGVIGRLEAADDGEIYLGGNTYRIERLTVDLANPRAITPEVNFSAQTRIGNLPIAVDLRCPAAGPCERKVTSLATGIDDKEAEARLFGTAGGAAAAGENLARLLSGELLGVVGRTIGLDAIRLEQEAERRDIFDDPTLISGDVDPAARLTLAKRVGSNVELVYSQNLAEEGFTWITSYSGPFGLSWRFLILDDQSRSYEFRHELPIGAGRTRQRSRPPAPRIAAVRIEGTPGLPENELRKRLKLGEGDRFTFGAWQRDRDRLERFYHDQGFLEARIRARRLAAERGQGAQDGSPSEERVILDYRISRGPSTELVVRGAALPDDIRNRIVERWTTALFDGFLERDARTLVREHFYRQGYLDASVTAVVAADRTRGSKTLTLEVEQGTVVPRRIDVTGNSVVPAAKVVELASAGDAFAAWLDPASVERVLENHYRSDGFLAADASVGRPEMRQGTSVVPIQVIEGKPFSIGDFVMTGLPGDLEQQGREAVALVLAPGVRYRPADIAAGIDRLDTQLRRAAYRTASTNVETVIDEPAARVNVTVRVAPGPRSILQDVVVEGADETKPSIARSIKMTTGAPLEPAGIRETRQRLYDLDVYRSVDIQVQPLASDSLPGATSPPVEQPVMARITLEERPRYRVRYGLAVSDEEIGPDERDRRLGVAADVEHRNVFGRGLTAGVSLRLRRDQQVGRLTLGSQRFFGLPLRSTVFIEREREQLNPEGALPVTSDVNSITAEQAYRLRRAVELRYGYGIERNHTFIRADSPDLFDLTVKVARLTTSGLVDNRDDAFNPARGWFVSSAVELSRPSLGSDLSFLKDFSQYLHFFGLGRGLVLAAGARLGLARTIEDEVLIPSERFFAGGANTVRGYREDDLGARGVFDDAEGGEGLLVLNGELRFPIYRWLRGVGFVDAGNVFPKARDISFTDLQIGVGGGARFDTPFGLIRFDLGIPANPRSFDPKWRVHIGLGHSF
jgi:outer membrane protein assembly factor BamA/autotransporter translocation and assembly factor TamB